jgi:hypothetical protein
VFGLFWGQGLGLGLQGVWVDYVGIVGVLLGLQRVYGLILWVVCRVLLWVVAFGSCGCS